MHTRHDRLEQLFWQAGQIEAGTERDAYLNQECGDDSSLRREVQQMLGLVTVADKFAEACQPTIAIAQQERIGECIGPYKLREKIGEGGFGIVYVAEQEQPIRRKVALKLIKPGMDSNEIIARFEAERQTLALMDHLHIAKVHDAGTTENGRPYFVMELVNGVSITQYAESEKLSLTDRLRLMKSVCAAVEHAHQKGIIHRDLKPSNVLVTLHDGEPIVKVIDFGVAKAINQRVTSKTIYTSLGQMIGTPMYMSPEQAERSGLDVDTRSDVYSLGVVLYELLTGMTPFDRESLRTAGIEAMLQMILEVEPPRPSLRVSTAAKQRTNIRDRRRLKANSLSDSLRGELDWIVMKALEKQRERRYQSAQALRSDLDNYLSKRPVDARPPSWAYFARKYVHRHRSGLGTLAAVILVLGSLIGSWFWVVRERAAVSEQQAADRAQKISRLDQRLAGIGEQIDAQQWSQALASTNAYLTHPDAAFLGPSRLADLEARRAELQLILGLESAQLLGTSWSDHGFDYRAADSEFRAAFGKFGTDMDTDVESIAQDLKKRITLVEPVVSALDAWAGMVNEMEDQKESYYARTLRGSRPSDLRTRSTREPMMAAFASQLLMLAGKLDRDPLRNRIRDAVSRFVPGESRSVIVDIAREASTPALPASTLRLLSDALCLVDNQELAVSLMRQAQLREPNDFWVNYALIRLYDEHNRKALSERMRFASAALAAKPDNAWLINCVGEILYRLGDHDEAKRYYRRATSVDPMFLFARTNLALVHGSQGDIDAARKVHLETLESNPGYAPALASLSVIYVLQDKPEQAAKARKQAYLLHSDPPYVLQSVVGQLFFRRLYSEGIEAIEEAIRVGVELYGDDYTMFAEMLANKGEKEQAIGIFEKAHQVGFYREFGEAINLLHYGRTLYELNKDAEAYDRTQQGIRSAVAVKGQNDLLVVGDLNLLAAELLVNSSDSSVVNPEKALHHARRSIEIYQSGDHSERCGASWKTLADALTATGRYVDSLEAFHKQLCLQSGEEHADEAAIRKAVAIRAIDMANQLKGCRKIEQALMVLKAAAEMAPGFADIYVNHGMTLRYVMSSENHDAEAIGLFRQATRVDRKFFPGHGQLARVLANSNDLSLREPEQALKHAQICRELLGNSALHTYSLATLGMAQYRMGMYSQAIETLQKAREAQASRFESPHAPLDIFTGMSHWHLGNEEEAKRWFERAQSPLQSNAQVSMVFKTTLDEAESIMPQLER